MFTFVFIVTRYFHDMFTFLQYVGSLRSFLLMFASSSPNKLKVQAASGAREISNK